jgi:hypothetical protein
VIVLDWPIGQNQSPDVSAFGSGVVLVHALTILSGTRVWGCRFSPPRAPRTGGPYHVKVSSGGFASSAPLLDPTAGAAPPLDPTADSAVRRAPPHRGKRAAATAPPPDPPPVVRIGRRPPFRRRHCAAAKSDRRLYRSRSWRSEDRRHRPAAGSDRRKHGSAAALLSASATAPPLDPTVGTATAPPPDPTAGSTDRPPRSFPPPPLRRRRIRPPVAQVALMQEGRSPPPLRRWVRPPEARACRRAPFRRRHCAATRSDCRYRHCAAAGSYRRQRG